MPCVYIFLDVDGVLNKQSQWDKMFTLDNGCIDAFCKFALKLEARIVLTSTWRMGFVGSKNRMNTIHVQKLEQAFAQYGLRIIDKTTIIGRRDEEVVEYVKRNNIIEYIILDDDKSLFQTITKHNYFVDSKLGFTEQDAKKIYKLVKKVL